MKRWGLGALLILVVSLISSCGGSMPQLQVPGNPDDLDDVYDSIVALVEVDENGMRGPYCTASFVSPRRLATAAHCVQEPNSISIAGITIQLPGAQRSAIGSEVQLVTRQQYADWRRIADEDNNNPEHMTATVVMIDDEDDHDVALLELADGQPDSEHWLEMRDLEDEPLRAGETIYSIGMPLGHIWILTNGIVSRVHLTHEGGINILHQIRVGPGSSGAPVLDHRGRLVGVHSSSWRSRGGGNVIGEAKPVSYVKTMIRVLESQREIEELDRRFEQTREQQ